MGKSASTFGAWLAQQRKAGDLTQDELARRVGCSVALIRKIESNERKPSKQVVELLADVFGVDAEKREDFRRFARHSDSADTDATAQPVPAAPAAASPRQFVSAPAPKTNLGPQPTPLLGREWELAALRNRLLRDDARLVSLIGPPGIGKTRLAIALAQSLLKEFPDGAYFVSLAPVPDAEAVIAALAHALGITLSAKMAAQSTLREVLAEKQMLLVLDNFEHVLPAAGAIADLLASCVWLKALVTSREPLRIRLERQFAVQSLALPAPQDGASGPVDEVALQKYAAIALFVERAQAVDANFTLRASNAADVRAICSALEGVPLALELAASWVYLLSCGEIAAEIRRNLDFLTTSAQDIPQRHRSLRAAFDHSWALLSDEQRRALCNLSIFSGGFTRQAAEQVGGSALATLAALLSKSLLRRGEDGRYDMHEFVRQFALDRLRQDAAEHERLLAAYTRWYAGLLYECDAPLRSGDQMSTIGRLMPELDNLHQAWQLAVERHALTDLRHMARSWAWFLSLTGQDREAHATFAHAADMLDAQLRASAESVADPVLQAAYTHILLWRGFFDYIAESYDVAVERIGRAAMLARDSGDPSLLADSLRLLGMQARLPGGKPARYALIDESVGISRAIGDIWGEARSINIKGEIEYGDGQFEEARGYFEGALPLHRNTGDPNELAVCLCYLGATLAQLGEHASARAVLEEGLSMARQTSDRWLHAFALRMLGTAYLRSGEIELAQSTLAESAQAHKDVRDYWGQTRSLETLGEALQAGMRLADAHNVFRQALAIAQRRGWRQDIAHLLVRLAELALTSGFEHANDARVHALLSAALDHGPMRQDFAEKAAARLAEVEARLSPQQRAAAQARLATPVQERVAALLTEIMAG